MSANITPSAMWKSGWILFSIKHILDSSEVFAYIFGCGWNETLWFPPVPRSSRRAANGTVMDIGDEKNYKKRLRSSHSLLKADGCVYSRKYGSTGDTHTHTHTHFPLHLILGCETHFWSLWKRRFSSGPTGGAREYHRSRAQVQIPLRRIINALALLRVFTHPESKPNPLNWQSLTNRFPLGPKMHCI